jgi:hypothetical protein
MLWYSWLHYRQLLECGGTSLFAILEIRYGLNMFVKYVMLKFISHMQLHMLNLNCLRIVYSVKLLLIVVNLEVNSSKYPE